MDKINLDGKVAVVTGGGGGIGRELALTFARSGASVTIADINADTLSVTAQSMVEMGQRLLPIECNTTVAFEVDRMINMTLERFGKIDILFNNAGIGSPQIPAEEISEEQWDEMISTNLKSTWLCSKSAGKVFIRQNNGKIINLTSVSAVVPFEGLTHFSVSKGGITTLTKCLALEWAKYNIQVNAIGVGPIETPTTEKRLADPELLQKINSKLLIKRTGKPADISEIALLLASDSSSYITGQTFYIDGGWLIS